MESRLDLSLDPYEWLRSGLDPVHRLPVIVQEATEVAALPEVGVKELDGPKEVPVMVVLGALVVQRVHPVGRRRKQQETHVRIGEEPSRQPRRGVPSVEEVLETLKFVQDHEVGLKRRDTHLGQHQAKLADKPRPSSAIAGRDMLPKALESLAEVRVALLEPSPLLEETSFEGFR